MSDRPPRKPRRHTPGTAVTPAQSYQAQMEADLTQRDLTTTRDVIRQITGCHISQTDAERIARVVIAECEEYRLLRDAGLVVVRRPESEET